MRRMLMATVVAALVVLALAIPASARPAGPDSADTAAVASTVPVCVTTALEDSGYRDYLTVFNGCNYAVRVKVVLAYKQDFPCYTIGADSVRHYTWTYPGRFDGLVGC
jgi:hypothetical protein